MYRNLEAELARRGLKKTYLATQLGVTIGTLSLKLSGKSNLTLPEAVKIKELVDDGLTMEYLFSIDEIFNKDEPKTN